MNESLEHRLEEALEENRRLRELLALVVDDAYVTSDGSITSLAISTPGESVNEVAGQLRAELQTLAEQSVQSGNLTNVIVELNLGDDSKKHFRVRGKTIRRDDAAQPIWIGCVQDITSSYTIHAEHRDQRESLVASRERLTTALQASEMAVYDVDLQTGKTEWSNGAENLLGVDINEDIKDMFPRIVVPEYIEIIRQAYRASVENRESLRCEALVIDTAQKKRWIAITGTPYFDEYGFPVRMIGSLQDVSARHQADDWLIAQKRVLELIATGESLAVTLKAIIEMIETGFPESIATLMQLDNQGYLHLVAGDNLPNELIIITAHVMIGPNAGSCGAAAYRREIIITDDVESDEKWIDYADCALRNDIRSCWSFPIMAPSKPSHDNLEHDDAPRVLGTFGVYHSCVCRPNEEQLKRISDAVHLASIALENHRIEQDLLDSEHRFRELANAMPQLVWTTDPSGKCNFSNRLLSETIGDGLSLDWGKVVHPDDCAESLHRHLKSVHSGQPYTMEHRLKMLATGEYRWFLARAVPSCDKFGKVQTWYGTATDIDDLKRAQESLREERDRLSAIAESSPSTLFSVVRHRDGSTYFVYAAPSITKIFDIKVEDLLADASHLYRLIEPTDLLQLHEDFQRLDVAAISGDNSPVVIHREFRVTHPLRGCIWVELISSPRSKSNQEVVWHGIMTDVTHRRMLETQLFQSAKVESIITLAGGIAHDFNNLLTVILGSCQLLEFELANDPSAIANVEAIKQSSQRAANLTKQLLAFSRQQEITTQNVNISQLMQEGEVIFQHLVAPHKKLIFDLDPNVPNVFADPTQLEQVLINLLVNARDAIDADGIINVTTRCVHRSRPEVNFNDQAKYDYVEIAVRDDGHGMTEDVKLKIFDPFFTTKPIGKGTGLGLAVVHGIVVQNCGFIEVDSAPGNGTTMRVYLPAVSTKYQDFHVASLSKSDRNHARKILVVDDEMAVCEIASRTLQAVGYIVQVAETVESATQIFEDEAGGFDLLVTDIYLPDGHGFDLAESLRLLKPELAVVLMTGVAVAVSRFREIPDVAVIQKPFMPVDLHQIIHAILSKQHAP